MFNIESSKLYILAILNIIIENLALYSVYKYKEDNIFCLFLLFRNFHGLYNLL